MRGTIFIHYSAEGTKCVFAEITKVPFPLSVILKAKCFILPVILPTLQHRSSYLKLKGSLQKEEFLHKLCFTDTYSVQCGDKQIHELEVYNAVVHPAVKRSFGNCKVVNRLLPEKTILLQRLNSALEIQWIKLSITEKSKL